jgi:hypothetical protein
MNLCAKVAAPYRSISPRTKKYYEYGNAILSEMSTYPVSGTGTRVH